MFSYLLAGLRRPDSRPKLDRPSVELELVRFLLGVVQPALHPDRCGRGVAHLRCMVNRGSLPALRRHPFSSGGGRLAFTPVHGIPEA